MLRCLGWAQLLEWYQSSFLTSKEVNFHISFDPGHNTNPQGYTVKTSLSFPVVISEIIKVVPNVFLGVVLMEIAEAHRKVYIELEENVSSLVALPCISSHMNKTNDELYLLSSIVWVAKAC